jgi:hypothetical protein
MAPTEYDPPLIVDADTVLSCTITLQGFQAIGRGHTQIGQGSGIIQHSQLPPGHGLNILRQTPRNLTMPNHFRFPAGKTFDHSITSIVI